MFAELHVPQPMRIPLTVRDSTYFQSAGFRATALTLTRK